MAYEYHDGEYVEIGEEDTALSPRAAEALDDWYASEADRRLAERYDRDEDALREQQYERQAGLA